MTTEMQHENTRRGIGVMTAWTADVDGPRLAAEQLQALVRDDGLEGLVATAAGLINLCGLLLLLREREQGATPEATLQSIAAGPINMTGD